MPQMPVHPTFAGIVPKTERKETLQVFKLIVGLFFVDYFQGRLFASSEQKCVADT